MCGYLLYPVHWVRRALQVVWLILGTIYLFNAPVYLCKTEGIFTFQKALWIIDLVELATVNCAASMREWELVSRSLKGVQPETSEHRK